MSPAIYGNAYDITQAPGIVAIRYEMIHETRIIPLDNSPRPEPAAATWASRAAAGKATRWSWSRPNFSDRSRFRNASAKARLVERFKPVAPDRSSGR